MNRKKKVIIIGAGPAGLATAYEFLKKRKLDEYDIHIFECSDQVGGISKTLDFQGYRFDLGGHRFYTKFPEIKKFYENFLEKDMLRRKRLSRIYYNQLFFDYPLSAGNALNNLGIIASIQIVFSWLSRQLHKHSEEKTFDQWVSNRFGDRLFKIFFKSYTEKVWGIPTSELSADWAAQRIQNFNLGKAMISAITKSPMGAKTAIKSFHYPKYGPGMLYKKLQKMLEKKGVHFYFNTFVNEINLKKNSSQVTSIGYVGADGNQQKIGVDSLVSTMPFNELILLLKPSASLKRQIKRLQFRNFITVNLIIKNNPFPDQWIYIHEPQVKVGRIQNFRNWSPYMIPEGENNTPIGMEYFASKNDELWKMSDAKLLALAKQEIVQLGLVQSTDIIDGFVYRVNNAYPVYNFDYQTPLLQAKVFIQNFKNIFPCGRGGLFRYNNQDHSILSGFYVARNILAGETIQSVWDINDDDMYLEEKESKTS